MVRWSSLSTTTMPEWLRGSLFLTGPIGRTRNHNIVTFGKFETLDFQINNVI